MRYAKGGAPNPRQRQAVSAHGSRALSYASFGTCGTDVEGRRADTEDPAYDSNEQEIPPFDLKYIHVPAALYDPEHVAIKKLNDAITSIYQLTKKKSAPTPDVHQTPCPTLIPALAGG